MHENALFKHDLYVIKYNDLYAIKIVLIQIIQIVSLLQYIMKHLLTFKMK